VSDTDQILVFFVCFFFAELCVLTHYPVSLNIFPMNISTLYCLGFKAFHVSDLFLISVFSYFAFFFFFFRNCGNSEQLDDLKMLAVFSALL